MHYVRPLDWREGGGGKTENQATLAREAGAHCSGKKMEVSVVPSNYFFSANNARSLYDVFGKSKVPDKEMSPNFFLFFRSHTFFTFFTFTSTW